jgi:hypothetical protein
MAEWRGASAHGALIGGASMASKRKHGARTRCRLRRVLGDRGSAASRLRLAMGASSHRAARLRKSRVDGWTVAQYGQKQPKAKNQASGVSIMVKIFYRRNNENGKRHQRGQTRKITSSKWRRGAGRGGMASKMAHLKASTMAAWRQQRGGISGGHGGNGGGAIGIGGA